MILIVLMLKKMHVYLLRRCCALPFSVNIWLLLVKSKINNTLIIQNVDNRVHYVYRGATKSANFTAELST
jgi:hypothetical protein